MNKKTAELEEKKNELASQVQLLQEKATELESQLTSQQEHSTTEVILLFIDTNSVYFWMFNRLLN